MSSVGATAIFLSPCDSLTSIRTNEGPAFHPLFLNIFQYTPYREKQIMRGVLKEEGVLKLVHPGRYVEIHREPIPAAAVLRKYPRHSITRPDVFEYPWIVVHPESILNLGKVFLIVPNCTIYHLLKAHKKRRCQRSSPCRSLSPQNNDNQELGKQGKPKKLDPGMTPKHPNHDPWLKQSFAGISCLGLTSPEQDYVKTERIQSEGESWAITVSKNRNRHLELDQKSEKHARLDIRSESESDYQKDYHLNRTNIRRKFLKENNEDPEFNRSTEAAEPKSCLRKSDSARKSLQLRVSFLLPEKKEEQKRKMKTSGTESIGYHSCGFTDFFLHPTNFVPTSDAA